MREKVNIVAGTVASRILAAVQAAPGLTDRELTTRLFSSSTHPSQVNQTCRRLEVQGQLRRMVRPDGVIGNFPKAVGGAAAPAPPRAIQRTPALPWKNDTGLSEDEVKQHLAAWLEAAGWSVEVAWGKARGADIRATRGTEQWIMEVKGCGSLQPMRVNYFIGALGELLQRMDVEGARYSLAFPDMQQFRRLWERLPGLAKARTGITTLFVRPDGMVEEKK